MDSESFLRQYDMMETPQTYGYGIKAKNQNELNQEIEEIKDALRILVRNIDRFGFAPWPLFERLEKELELRENIEARMNRWRES